ncbi:MAG: hypothetical protein EBU66_20925 [Bacteroidetes bacterium]|nr:hypothetical protein [Bacteroidota bacterium]
MNFEEMKWVNPPGLPEATLDNSDDTNLEVILLNDFTLKVLAGDCGCLLNSSRKVRVLYSPPNAGLAQ